MNIFRTSLLFLVSLLFLSACDQSSQKLISVNATASVNTAPELARFNFLIDKRGKNLTRVKNDIDIKAGKLVELCKKLGIKTKDITAAEITIEPRYNYNNNAFLGYRITRTISATLYDLTKYSQVIEGAVKAGITNISNISLEVKKENSLEDKALASAVKKAKNKAQLLASLNNVQLGEVLEITESGAPRIYAKYRAEKKQLSRRAMPNAVFEPGQLSISKTVSIVYSIK